MRDKTYGLLSGICMIIFIVSCTFMFFYSIIFISQIDIIVVAIGVTIMVTSLILYCIFLNKAWFE
jgi:hypothetical protein